MNQKQYRDRHLERCREYCRDYYYTHKEERKEKKRKKKEEATRSFMVEYQQKRDNTFGMTLQRHLDYFHSEKKRTEEKLKALGPQKLTMVLTDYLKSPPPPPSTDLRTPAAMYLELFCESLEVEEPSSSSSFLDMLTMTNLDSGQITAMDHSVWDQDANQ